MVTKHNQLKVLLFVVSMVSLKVLATDLRVITVQEPPANFLNKNNQVDGYVTDIVKALFRVSGYKTNIELLPEARAIHISMKDPNVLLFSFSRTPFRENKYYWVGEVLRKSWFVYSINNAFNNVSTLDQLRNMPVIGVTRGDVREEFLIEHGFSNLNSVTNHNQNVQLLLLGRLPLIAYEQQGLTATCQSLNKDCSIITKVYKLNSASGYILMSKQPETNSTHLKKLRNAYQTVLDNGDLKQISLKWMNTINKQETKVSLAADKPILVF